MRTARIGRGAVASLLALLLLAACTGSEDASETPSPSEDARVRGFVLNRAGFGGTFELVELPSAEVTPLRLPDFGRTVMGFFDEDGTVIALLEGPDGVALYRLAPDADPVALGDPLPAGDTMSHGGGSVLVTACTIPPAAHVLDLGVADPRWRPVEAGCGAALSPDGRTAAWSPDGAAIVEAPVDGSAPPSRVAEVDAMPVPEAAAPEAAFALPIAWQDEGRAVLVASGGWQGVVLGEDPSTLTPLGDRGAGPLQVFLDWQPGAPVLAVGSSTSLGGTVRLVDDAGSRAVAIFGEPATGTAWSPRGDALLAASNGVWAVVTPEGEWLWSRIVGRGQEPLDWWIPG